MMIPPNKTSDEGFINLDIALTECDRFPLHHIDSIQANSGHVLYWRYPSGTIVAADALIHQVIWIRKHGSDKRNGKGESVAETAVTPQPPLLLGASLKDWIPEILYHDIMDIITGMVTACSQRAFHFATFDSQTFAFSISTTFSDYSLIGMEIELVKENDNSEIFLNTLVHLGRILECQVEEVVLNRACDILFASLGCYDRGMVHRIYDDLSGEVIHEIKHEHIRSSYKGLRYPSSDIPLSARKLFAHNRLRYIHDTDVDSIPLLSNSDTPIDMTQCRMRAVAKPHILYLRNMGVVCSLSFAIIVDNELWGIFVFHGYGKPTKPSLHQRIACETITSIVSVRIETIVKKAQSARIIQLQEILMSLKNDQNVIHNLHDWGSELLRTLDADILVGHIQDPLEGEGDNIVLGDASLAPSAEFWAKMTLSQASHELCVMSTRVEVEKRGLTKVDCPASGIMYFRQNRMHIMLGRDVRSKDVEWAGDPDEPKLRIGGILHPRQSFAMFMEKARQESRAWNRHDLQVISTFRDHICNHSHKWMMELLRNNIDDTNQKYMLAIESARDNYAFFAHMSHELRTPFHGVMGCLNNLKDSLDDLSHEGVKNLLETALTSGHHMINLLNEILNISKNTHLSHTCSNDAVIYQTLAFEVIYGMKTFAMSQKIPLTCTISPKNNKIIIHTDRTKVIQIVSNTVNNSLKFTRNGGVHVQFSLVNTLHTAMEECEKVSSNYSGVVYIMEAGKIFSSIDMAWTYMQSMSNIINQKWMCIRVSDTGCGIAPTELVNMFEPFIQASAGSNRNFQGTGLGLYICLSLCQQLNGFIVCASTLGVGTVVHIFIPVQIGDETTAVELADVNRTAPLKDIANIILMRGPIMIVDDNRVNVRILHRALQISLKAAMINLDVFTVEGGDAAIAFSKDTQPSLCIIDYCMPETDGIATASTIRAYEEAQGLEASHILCFTIDVTDQTKQLVLLRSGFDDAISKPPYNEFIADLVSRMHVVENMEESITINESEAEKNSAI